MELDPSKLDHAFYKKQDYEPFAIPFGYPVLDDINWKIELKKVDQAISRTIQNVILLITMGADPDKGGINPHNLQAMQSLFRMKVWEGFWSQTIPPRRNSFCQILVKL